MPTLADLIAACETTRTDFARTKFTSDYARIEHADHALAEWCIAHKDDVVQKSRIRVLWGVNPLAKDVPMTPVFTTDQEKSTDDNRND